MPKKLRTPKDVEKKLPPSKPIEQAETTKKLLEEIRARQSSDKANSR